MDSTEISRLQAFEDYLKAFENLTKTSLHNDLKQKWHPLVEFKDPFNHVYNQAHCVRIFEHMFTQCIEPEFRINQSFFSNSSGSVYWTFKFKTPAKPKSEQVIIGNSYIEMDEENLITKHIDYWDTAENLYEKVPLLGSLIRLIKKRLKVN